MIEIALPLMEGSIFDMSLLSAVHLALCLESPFHAGTTACIKAWERLFMPADHLHLQLVIVTKCTGFDYNLDLCMSDPCYINCRNQVSMKTKRGVVWTFLFGRGIVPPQFESTSNMSLLCLQVLKALHADGM